MSEWTKANRPPDSDRRVLIYPGIYGGVSVGRYERYSTGGVWTDDTESVGDEGTPRYIAVQYWMPLPKPPSKGMT